MRNRRRGYAHMDLGGAGVTDQLDDLLRCRAAHDAIVDQHDAVAPDDARIGRMLELDAELADALLRLDECASDVVIADDAKLERNAALLAEPDCRRHARIRYWHDDIGAGRCLSCELDTHAL